MLKPETICTINGYGMVNAAHINENWPTLLCRLQERFSREGAKNIYIPPGEEAKEN
jgi:hypothetical protein